MNTSTVSNTQNDNPTLTFGKLLAQTRTEQGLSLEDVSKRTRLRTDVLCRLENDDWEIPHFAPSFVRGYLVSYARFLRIPEPTYTPYLADFNNSSPSIAKIVLQRKPIPIEESRSRWIGTLTLIILLILLGITGLWWWENHQKQTVERTERVTNYEKMQQSVPLTNEPASLTLPAQNASDANLLSGSDTALPQSK